MCNTGRSHNIWISDCRRKKKRELILSMIPSYRYTGLAVWFHTWNNAVYEFLCNLYLSASNTVLRHWDIFSRGRQFAVALPRASPTCSTGLRSGDVLGQSIRQISSLSNNSSTRRILCGLALSSIKLNSNQQHSWKGKNRSPKRHPYTSQ